MSITVDQTLLAAAQHIAPVIRAYNQEAEHRGRLSKPALDALADASLLRMLTPRSLGGLEVDPLTCARVIEEVSRFDSAAGWSLVNILGWAWLCARLPDRGAEEIFRSNPNGIIAGPFHTPMQATPVDGGYRITGRASLASNCHDATWLGVTAMVMDGNAPRQNARGEPEVVIALCSSADCEILDTWSVMGMRGTGSNDIALTQVFVPGARTSALVPAFAPGSHYQGPLYRFPLMGLIAATNPLVMLGMAREAINELVALAQGKTPFVSTTLLRERPAAQARVGQAEAALRAARALLYDTLAETWERTRAGELASLEQKTALLLAATNATQSSAQVVELMYNAAGSTGFYTRSPLERLFRDAQVLKQHGFMSESRWETAGQVYLGLQPDFALVAF
jgi:alkylation response protein AidB-like acyl-CoA dehydrogenase